MKSLNTPLVSVLMPSYNSEKYIGVAIESVLKSTYKNFELIITDDRSTDTTFQIAKEFEKKDSRVKVILNDTNYGDYPNRNQVASYANGKYLKYVDHDDYIYPYGLEQLVHYMEQFPDAGYGLCSLNQHKTEIYPLQLSPVETYKMNYFEMELFHKAPLSAIIKRDVFESVGGFTGKPFLGDFELWHILSRKYPVVLMPHGIVWYRIHANQESKRVVQDPMNSFNYLIVGKSNIESNSCPLNRNNQITVINIYKKKQVRSILSALRHHSFKKSVELFKASRLSALDIFKNLI